MILKDRNDPTTKPLRDFPVALTVRLRHSRRLVELGLKAKK
jgi:hypothetical protein